MGAELKKWSVLVYIAADSDDKQLQAAALFDLAQMKKAGSNTSVYVVAQADLPEVPTRRYIFPEKKYNNNDDSMSVIELDRNINSADPQSIVDFFTWSNAECPGENILLILWGHGFGLDDFDPFLLKRASTSTKGRPESIALPAENRFQFAFPLLDAPIVDISTGAFPDAAQRVFLGNNQIARALSECRKSLGSGQNLAILGFDACDMSLLEVWFEMAGSADLGIGSQYGIPYKGWPYEKFLGELLKHPELTPRELSSLVVETFVNYNDALRSKPVITLSTCDLTRGDEVAKTIGPLAEALARASSYASSRLKIFEARNDSPIYDQDGYIDLEGFCRQLQFYFPDSDISRICEEVCTALRHFVLHHGFAPKHTAKKISLSTGVSVWFPPWIQYPDIVILEKEQSEAYLSRGYSKTRFAIRTRWDVFLKSILRNARNCSQEEITMSSFQEEPDDAAMMGPTPPKGRPPQMGPTPPKGKSDSVNDEGRGGRVFQGGPAREAGVVVRATVEAFGPVGDTELNVTVKWPAGNNVPVVIRDTTKSADTPIGGAANVD